MRIIEGFGKAKEELSRSAVSGLATVSESLKERLMTMFGTSDAEEVVSRIIEDVKNRGDVALFEYTEKIDGVRLNSLSVSREEIDQASREVDSSVLSALRLSAERVSIFHTTERDSIFSGLRQLSGQIVVRPLEKAGIYVPGGTAPLPSTVIMTAIPAKIAGVSEIVLASPPQKNGKISSLVLAAADIAGVSRIFSIGGAQAVAALAFGTESVPKVDKICGPGNVFVMLAKKQVFGTVDIDGLEGPSEVVIVADDKADSTLCAADLIAQAEHDVLASAVLVTTSKRLANELNAEVENQLAGLPRQKMATESLNTRGRIAVVESVDEAIEIANLYAPEHLCLMIENASQYVDKVKNAGCVFVGEGSAEVLGDYVAGPSHALPTGGTARFGSPLDVMDYIKFMNVVSLEEGVSRRLFRAAAILARAEGLEGHARSADKRIRKEKT